MVCPLVVAQVVLSVLVQGEGPVRFGVPLPDAALRRGLRADGGARLQWRALQRRPDPVTGRTWVEVCLLGASARTRISVGGVPAAEDEGGDVVVRRCAVHRDGDVEIERTEWHWRDGTVDWRERRLFSNATHHAGEAFAAGEACTVESEQLRQRVTRARIEPKWWRGAGVLPPGGRRSAQRRHDLVEIAKAMQSLPGLRGRGDYARSGGVVTNLEFDTVLGLVRMALAVGDPGLLMRAVDSARHLIDIDLHRGQGLPYRHGTTHRSAPPEAGHVWLSGLLLVGCVMADDSLVAAARTMALGLARQPARVQRDGAATDRARDVGWPLLEMEAWLRFEPHPVVARAADALAADVRSRFDARAAVFRFGEGERRRGVYEERAWLTGGILLPALRAHLRRRPDPGLREQHDRAKRRLLRVLTDGRPGLPVRYWVADGATRGQVRLRRVPELFLLLEGLDAQQLDRVLARSAVRRSLAGVPDRDHPDLATHWSMVARCEWVLR